MSAATRDAAWVCNCAHACVCDEPVPYAVTIDTVAPSDEWWWAR